MMAVYLLHFDAPIAPGRHTCQHYIEYTEDLERRIAEHRAGRGARLCEVAKERGIGFHVVNLWPGDRELERRLKNQKNAPALCPICHKPHGQLDLFNLDSFSLDDVVEMEF